VNFSTRCQYFASNVIFSKVVLVYSETRFASECIDWHSHRVLQQLACHVTFNTQRSSFTSVSLFAAAAALAAAVAAQSASAEAQADVGVEIVPPQGDSSTAR
jgi:hypothetical protein